MHKQAPREVVPNELTRLMRDRGVKDVKLAAHCDVDQSTVYRWRLCFSPIPDEKKVLIAQFLRVSVPEVMGWDCDGAHDEVPAA
jgi:hypothetical protein